MITGLMPEPKIQFFDNAGRPLAGGLLYTYYPERPGILKPTYTDATASAYNTNPVVLDSAGRASVWLDGYYNMELKTSTGVTIWTQSNISSFGYDNLAYITGVVADNETNINTVAANIVDVNTVADNINDVTNFSNVYYGPSATPPTTRKNGDPLENGDLYFDTVNDKMNVYSFNTSAWLSTTSGTVYYNQFDGTGSQTDFVLSAAPKSINNTQIYISGVYISKDQYTLNGSTVSFLTPPALGTKNIEVVTIDTLDLGETDSAFSVYRPGVTGSTDTYVQTELRKTTRTSNYAAFADAVSAAGGSLLVIDSDVAVSADTTYTEAATVLPGGKFTVASGKTLTINGPFSCGLFQCFDGGGSVVFGSGSVVEVYPEWFGAGDNIDSSDAIQKAINSSNKTVGTAGSNYLFTGRVTIPSHKHIDFDSCTLTRKTGSGVYDMLYSTGTTGIKLLVGIIDGNKDADSLVAMNAADRFCGIRFVDVDDSDIFGATVISTVNAEVQAEGNRAGIMLDSCNNVRVKNIIGYNNDRTAVMFVSCTYCSLDNALFYSNTGSGVSSANNDYGRYSNIFAHDNGYSQVSVNGLKSIVDNIIAWNGAINYSGINIGHDTDTGRSHGTVASNLISYNNAGWGITVYGSDDVSINGAYSSGNAVRNVYVFGNANSTKINGITVTGGNSTGIYYASGIGHTLNSADIYGCGAVGIQVGTSVGLTTGPGVKSYNNGIVTSANSAGLLNGGGLVVINGGEYYDNQATKTQESGIWAAGGTTTLHNPYVPTNKTYGLRETTSPVLLDRSRSASKTSPMFGTFTATAGTTTIISNENATADFLYRVIVMPTNPAAVAKGLPCVSSVSVGISFTLTFSSSLAGTETYYYRIM